MKLAHCSLANPPSCASVPLPCASRLLAPATCKHLPFLSACTERHMLRRRSQLIQCKAGPTGRQADEGVAISIPQSEDESVRTSTLLIVYLANILLPVSPTCLHALCRTRQCLTLLVYLLQIEQAAAALSLKMGQGKKGGKPMKVSTLRSGVP